MVDYKAEKSIPLPPEIRAVVAGPRGRPIAWDKKFDSAELEKLNNPDRLKDSPPELLASRLGNRLPKTIVDIGVGTGLFCRAFLTVFNPDTIYACDMSDTMLNWMQGNVVPDHPGLGR